MNRKYAYSILTVLNALSFAAAGAALSLMPDLVPVHYNFAGEVDRFGSKFEYLVFPVFGAVMAVIMALALRLNTRLNQKQSDKERALGEKIIFWSAVFEVLLFSGLGLFFMWKGAAYTPGDTGPAIQPDFLRLIGMGLGLLFVLLGNVMPKARRNALFGLRTTWSMADDEVWRKSQRFGGFSAVALGFLLIVTGIFMDWIPHLILCVASGAVWAAACIAASRYYYTRGQADHK